MAGDVYTAQYAFDGPPNSIGQYLDVVSSTITIAGKTYLLRKAGLSDIGGEAYVDYYPLTPPQSDASIFVSELYQGSLDEGGYAYFNAESTTGNYNYTRGIFTVSGGAGGLSLDDGGTVANFAVQSGQVNVAPQVNVEAIPEPASWIMMILGFGFFGGVIRYRRSQLFILRHLA